MIEPDAGVTGFTVHLCARSAVRAPAAHSPAAVHRGRAFPCGLNKEGKAEKKISWWWKDMKPILEQRPVWLSHLNPVPLCGSSLSCSALCQPVHIQRPGRVCGFFLWMKPLYRRGSRWFSHVNDPGVFPCFWFSVESFICVFISCWFNHLLFGGRLMVHSGLPDGGSPEQVPNYRFHLPVNPPDCGSVEAALMGLFHL